MERLYKVYGDGARALAGVTTRVNRGEFFGLLGPHGAGKTTMVRILAGLLKPDGGRASVLGYDVRTHAREIRGHIGYLGQRAGVDRRLTGRENVLLMARLHGLRGREAATSADEMLRMLELSALAGQQAGRYAAAEQRRLALAGALAHRPPLLLLDDAACGLPPQERAIIWRSLRAIHRDMGTTIFLATQCLDEAETLCDRVAIIDHGKLLAAGTPAELKAEAAGTLVAVQLVDGGANGEVALLLGRLGGVHAVRPQADRIDLEVSSVQTIPALVRMLEEHEVAVRDITLSRSSLEGVFFHHTGRKIQDGHEAPVGSTKLIGHR
jgi:ABC-2 type transport system ATP-binding protein